MTTDYNKSFAMLYSNFKTTELYADMVNMVENNDWHLEANVGVHTDMVVGEYLSALPDTPMTHAQYIGAIACMLHDIGKPVVCEPITKPDGTIRMTSRGHELESARMAENYLCGNRELLGDTFTANDIFSVCWIVENHLFYRITNPMKVHDLKSTSLRMISSEDDIFIRCISADALGRLGVNDAETKAKLDEWVSIYNDVKLKPIVERTNDTPHITILIGASGSGKSTYFTQMPIPEDVVRFSYDDLRVESYGEQARSEGCKTVGEIYTRSWELATFDHDKEFKAHTRSILHQMVSDRRDIVIDNTNISKKSRTAVLNDARQRGYSVTAVVFPVTEATLIERLAARPDREMDPNIVINMYKHLSLPSIGQWVDEIIVWEGYKWINTDQNSKT